MIGFYIGLGLGAAGGPITPAGPPAAPSAFTVGRWALAGNAVSGQLAVTINSLPPSNGSTITDVEYRVDGGSWVSSSGITSFVIGSLTNGTEYDVELRAVNAIGNGDAGDLKSATPATYPAAPSVTLTAGDGQVSIAWTDGATNGSAITLHKLYWSTSSGVTTADYAGDIMTGSPYVLSGLTNDVPVYVKLAAVNGVGTGSLSTEKSATPAVVPAESAAITADADSFDVTNSEVGSTWQWYTASDDAAITGETTTSLAQSEIAYGEGAYVVPDGNSSRASNVLYRIPAVPAPTVTHYASSGQSNGHTLVDDGWTAFNKAGLMSVVSGVWTITQNYSNEGGWSKDLSTTDHALKVVHAYVNDSSDDTNHFDLAVRYGSAGNWIGASGSFATGGAGFNLQIQVGGVTTYLTPGNIHFPTNVDGNSIELVVRGHTLYLYMNDVLQVPNPDGDYVTADNGYDVSSATTLASNTKVAVIQLGANTLNEQVAHDIVTSAYPAAPIILSEAIFTAPLAASDYTKLEAIGTCPSGVTSMSIGWFDADGQPIYVETGLAASSSAFDVSDLVTPHILRGQAATMMFWETSDPTVIGYSSLPSIPAYQLVGDTEFGINLGFWNSIGGDYIRDRGQLTRWADPSNADVTTLNSDGWPSDTPTVGSYYKGILWESDLTGHRSGDFLVTWPANVTCSDPVATNISVGTIDNVAREVVVTVADNDSEAFLSFRFTPTGSVPGGIVITCFPVGETHPERPFTDQLSTDYSISAGFRSGRLMKQMGTELRGGEADPVTIYPRYFKPANVAWMIKNMGIKPHLSWSVLETESFIEAWMLDLKDELTALSVDLSTIVIYIEVGNEIWNYGYQQQDHRSRWLATKEGFVSGVTSGEQPNVIYYFNGGSHTTDRAFNSGDVVYNGDYYVVRAKRNTSSGATMPANSGEDNADFEYVNRVTGTMLGKWQGARQKSLAQLVKPLFPDGVIKSVLGCFIDDSAADLWSRMSDDGIWQWIDTYQPSGYVSNLQNYGDNAYDSASTTADYKDGVFTFLGTALTAAKAKLLSLKHDVEALIVASPDYTPGDTTPYIGTYEINWHWGYAHSTVPDDAVLAARMAAVTQDARWTAMVEDYCDWLIANIGGAHNWFVDVERRPTYFGSPGDKQFQLFGILDNYVGARSSEQLSYNVISTKALALLP